MTQAMRFDVSALDRASAVFDKVADAADRLQRKLKELERTKVEIKPRLDDAGINADVRRLQQKLRTAFRNLPRAKIEVDLAGLTAAERKVAQLARKLGTLTGASARVQVDSGDSIPRITLLTNKVRELQALSPVVLRVSLNSQINVAQIEARIREIERQLARINGTTVSPRVNLDRSWSDAVVHVTALGRALRTLAIPGAIAAAAPSIAALGGAALSAVGAIGLLPAGLFAAGAAAAGLKVGLSGVGDALKELNAAKFDPKKFSEALSKLAPAAREFVMAVKQIGPAWNSVKLDTQQRLFAGLGAEMQKLSAAYLPTMRTGLGAIATEFNLLGKDFVGFATSARTVENVDAIFKNTATAMQAARPAAQNLAAAFLDIGVVGSQMLPELAGELTAATGRFRTFIDQARRSGELKVWIQDGVNTLKQLGSIAGNVGGTLGAVFAAQKAAGASLLDTLDRVTAGMERWAKSAEGQRQMTAVFNEIRRTIDSIMPGLAALGAAAMQAMAAFANTGALSAAGQAFSAIATAIAPLIPALATLAGGVVNNLANALSAVATVVGPIVSGLTGLLGALGPIPAAVIAMVVAFRLLGPVNAMITSLGASLAGLATRAGATSAAAGAISGAFSKIGSAIPYVGVAVVALTAAWDALTVSSNEAAQAMDAGGAAAQKAAEGLALQTFAVDKLKGASGPLSGILRTLGGGFDVLTTSVDEARAAMTPLQQAQLDAAMATNAHRQAVEMYGSSSPQARSAMEELTSANDRLAAEQDRAADAGRTHADVVRDLASAMQSQIGSALAYEAALQRTAEAHERAGEALKKNGANSDQYKQSVLNLAQAQEQQAQAAQRQVEAAAASVGATNAAELGLRAYNTELLRLNDGSQQGRAAFEKIAGALSTAQLGMLSATAAASGLRTEILTLPDGRTVTVVTAADTAALDQVKVDLDAVVNSPWVGTVTVVGDPTRVNDTLVQTVANINGQTGTITLNGNNQPVQAVLGQSKYNIDATTGVMTIDGNPAPGEANLSGLKLRVDSTTGTITIEGNPAPAQSAIDPLQQPTQSEHTVNPNAGPAEGAVQGLQQPTQSEHTVQPNAGPAQGAIQGLQSPTSSTHTIAADAGAVQSAKALAQVNTGSTHTIFVNPAPVNAAIAAAQQATQSMHTLNVNDSAVTSAKSRAQQATNSMHTINCNDGAVTAAKNRARQATSSTHTIHVRVVGAAPPRAAGAYTTPRAEGAYATAYAEGGMRRMGSARAEVVPARQPRIIGDRMRGDEAFIPVNHSARSRAILQTTANRMGFDLTPRMTDVKAMGGGGTLPAAMLSSMRSAVSQRTASQTVLGDARVVAAIEALRQDLSSAPRQVHTEINVNGAGLQETASAVAQRQRILSAQGLFG